MNRTRLFWAFRAALVATGCNFAGGISHATATDAEFETWKTPLVCGGQTFTVESHCRSSGKPFELNQCSAGQRLSGNAAEVQIPRATPSKGSPSLFAVAWSCPEVGKQHLIILSYASGQGRGEEDESAEVFDLNLQPVKDGARQAAAFRSAVQAPHGRIRSVMPDGDVAK